MPTVVFNICCPRDWVSRHNGGAAGAPLKPHRDDSALRALSYLRANVGTVGKNWISKGRTEGDSKLFQTHVSLMMSQG